MKCGVIVVQSLSCVRLSVTPWTAAPCPSPGFPVHHQLPELAQTHAHWVGDAIQPSDPLSSPSPSAFNLSQDQGLFQWVTPSHQMAKGLELQLTISLSNEYSGLISIRIDCFDLLAVQRTLKSLLKCHMAISLFLLCTYKLNDLRKLLKFSELPLWV